MLPSSVVIGSSLGVVDLRTVVADVERLTNKQNIQKIMIVLLVSAGVRETNV